MLKGAVAGTSPTGPLTDGRTGARTPNNDEHQPMAHTTRPSMPLAVYSVKKLYIQRIDSSGGSKTESKSVPGTIVWLPGQEGQLKQIQEKSCAHK